MEIKPILEKISVFLKKYKYAALILTIGLALMMIPKKSEKTVEVP